MKTKMLLMAALVGAATVSAHAGVRFGFSFGFPMPTPVVVTAPVAPVIVAPAPVVVTAPAAVVVAAPPYPGVGYVWAPGFWSVNGYSRVWIPARWQYRPAHVAYVHAHGWHRW